MAAAYEDRADEFIEAMNGLLTELADRRDLRSECVIEAANLVAAVVDTDGRHTRDELETWTGVLGRRLDPPMILTPDRLRADDTLGGRKEWLDRPSTMFDLLVKADGRDGSRRAEVYYVHATRLAHATAALDQVPSQAELQAELDALDRFRTMLLTSMDDHGVPRPGRPARTAAATPAPTPQPEPDLPPERPIDDLLAELDALVGLDHVKAEVRKLTSLLRIQAIRAGRGLPTIETSQHLVFSGNPGTGKTTVARLLSQIFRSLGIVDRGHLVETDRSDLVAGYVGQTATLTHRVLESALGGTLLIDEAYALARGGENDFGKEAIDTIVKFMEDHRDDLSIVACGYPAEMAELVAANPGLRSRFTRTIHFPDYTTDELVAIFELIAGSKRYELDDGARERLRDLVDAEPRGRGFGNGRFVRNVFEAAVGLQALRLAEVEQPTDDQLTILTADDIVPIG
jgi:hypothetical protein